MKKNILFLLILLISILGACDNNTITHKATPIQSYSAITESPRDNFVTSGIHSETNLQGTFPRVETLNIVSPWYNPMRYSGAELWSQYIQEKFDINININITYPGNWYESNYVVKYLEENNNCVLYLNVTEYVNYEFNNQVFLYSNDQFAYELNPYYIKYGWNKYINPDYIEKLKINGKIYAVPASNPKYIYPRFYNKSYIEELNTSIPETIEELYEYLKRTKEINQSSDYYPMCIDSQKITPSTSDIYRAHGVYVNSEFNSMVSFNPLTNSFEDAAFAENMESALSFIKKLQQDNCKRQIGSGSVSNPTPACFRKFL
jgi:ABC-type glycerol-3-phosphate transport system substrate-binding protein